jgi:hypothetical protein
LVAVPRSVPRLNPVLELYGQFIRPHGLVFASTCAVNCGSFYRQFCAQCPINWIYHRWTPIKTWKHGWSIETGCTWAQFRVS